MSGKTFSQPVFNVNHRFFEFSMILRKNSKLESFIVMVQQKVELLCFIIFLFECLNNLI